MTHKETYRQLCEAEGCKIPLFQQYWWMETVCAGKQWEVALVERDGRVVAAMPYLIGHKAGMRYVLQPQLTQYSGPCLLMPSDISDARRSDWARKATSELIARIEALKVAYFCQHLSPALTDWMPFYWAGYEQTTRYTYRLEDIGDSDRLFAAFDRNERQKKILRYDGQTGLETDMAPAAFADYHHAYWHSRGHRDLLPKDFIARVCETAISHGQGLIATLHDADGHTLAARFVVYDEHCAYSLLSAYDATRYQNGYTETLIWKLLQLLASRTRAYDFEGSMDAGIEHFYRSFGATQTPYFQITKLNNSLFGLLLKAKAWRERR